MPFSPGQYDTGTYDLASYDVLTDIPVVTVPAPSDLPGHWRPALQRRLTARVSPSLAGANRFAPGTGPLGTWLDVQFPEFEVGFDGAGAITFDLPRTWGMADEPDEGGRGTLWIGRRVDLYVSDATTLMGGSLNHHLFRCTIAKLDRSDAGTIQVTGLPLTRILGTFIPLVVLSGDPVAEARRLVETWGGGLGWDPTSATASGITLFGTARQQTTLGSILEELSTVLGPSWHIYVTPQGNVKVTDDTALATTVHDLTAGAEAVECRMVTDAMDYATRVIITTMTDDATPLPDYKIATADDYDATDPHDWVEALPGSVDTAYAQDFADKRLLEKHRILSAGSCRVLASRYPIETLDIGHRVNLHVERARPSLDIPERWNGMGLRIAHLRWGRDDVTISFETPPLNIVADTFQTQQRTMAFMVAA